MIEIYKFFRKRLNQVKNTPKVRRNKIKTSNRLSQRKNLEVKRVNHTSTPLTKRDSRIDDVYTFSPGEDDRNQVIFNNS